MYVLTNGLKYVICATLLSAVAACGGGGSDDNGSDNSGSDNNGTDDTNPGQTGTENEQQPSTTVIPTLVPRATIAVAEGSQIVDTALSPSGDEVAVLSFKQVLNTVIFGDQYTLQVFDVATGDLVRTMNDPGETNGILSLYWGADQLTVLLFPGAVVWDATSGNVLNVRTSNGVNQCDGLSPVEAFNATTNVLIAGEAFGVPSNCVLNFSTGATNRYQLVKSATAARITSMALDPTGSKLSVSFENENLRDDSTQVYDAASFSPVGSARDAVLGQILAEGDGYQLYQDNADVTFQPTGVVIEGFDTKAAVSANGEVLVLHGANNTLNLIAMPEIVYIGQTSNDDASLRSISADGSVGAFVISDNVELYDLTGRSNVSAVMPAMTFTRQFSGTVTVDGVSEALNGTCNAVLEESLGPNIVDIEAGSASGKRLAVRGQNLLNFISYRYSVGAIDYVHSTTLAQNFSLDRPQLSTDGTNITGSTTLFTFSTTEFVELLSDATDPTGFKTSSLELDGVCAL